MIPPRERLSSHPSFQRGLDFILCAVTNLQQPDESLSAVTAEGYEPQLQRVAGIRGRDRRHRNARVTCRRTLRMAITRYFVGTCWFAACARLAFLSGTEANENALKLVNSRRVNLMLVNNG
jgi:hypothetical protein